MERTLGIIVLLFGFNLAVAQTDFNEKIYKSFVTSDMAKWKSTIDEMNRKTVASNSFLLELVNFQYGYIAYQIGIKNYKEARYYLEQAEKNLEELEKNGYNPSAVNSYKSAFNGFKIGLNALKAPFLGPKSIEYAEKAVKLNKNCHLGYIQKGNIQFYMPSAFGGSKLEALEYYKKAQKLMEQTPGQSTSNWNYLNLLIVIAQAHVKLNDYNSAAQYYEKILRVEPDFEWVKNEYKSLKNNGKA